MENSAPFVAVTASGLLTPVMATLLDVVTVDGLTFVAFVNEKASDPVSRTPPFMTRRRVLT